MHGHHDQLVTEICGHLGGGRNAEGRAPMTMNARAGIADASGEWNDKRLTR
jgi:hypothetical protein